VLVAKEDERHRICQLSFSKKVLDLSRVLHVIGLDHSVNLLFVAYLQTTFDVFPNYLRFFVVVNYAAKEQLETLEVAGTFKQFDEFEGTQAVLIGYSRLAHNSPVDLGVVYH